MNTNTATVISGSLGGNFMRVAADLATVLDDGDEMRVLGVLDKGALQNMKDIVYLKGVDIGIARSDTLAYLDKTGDIPNLRRRVTYLTRLFFDEVHLVTRKEITSIEQLRGQKFRSGRQTTGASAAGPRADFETFLGSENAGGARSARLSPQEREELFQSYMRWRASFRLNNNAERQLTTRLPGAATRQG